MFRVLLVVAVIAVGIYLLLGRDTPEVPPREDHPASTRPPAAPPKTLSSANDAPPPDSAPPAANTTTTLEVEMSDPNAVALAVATASVHWDTATDHTETAAITRAAHLCTDDLTAQLVEPQQAGALFIEAYSAQAISLPTLTPATAAYQPADTHDEVYRAYTATWIWVTPTGENWADPRTRTIYLTLLELPDQTWRVSSYHYADF